MFFLKIIHFNQSVLNSDWVRFFKRCRCVGSKGINWFIIYYRKIYLFSISECRGWDVTLSDNDSERWVDEAKDNGEFMSINIVFSLYNAVFTYSQSEHLQSAPLFLYQITELLTLGLGGPANHFCRSIYGVGGWLYRGRLHSNDLEFEGDSS